MKRISLIFLLCCILWPAHAQSWAKKAANAVFTLKTFSEDGNLLASSNGFFIGEQGEAISCFAPFKNASRAIIIDAQGKEFPVDCLSGINEMYDVAKFQVVAKKTTALSVASQAANNGSTVWLLPYSVKKTPTCIQGSISKAETFGNNDTYYTLAMTQNEQQVGCPVMNDQGEVIGILQPSANQKSVEGYAVSARFAASLHMNALSFNDPTLQNIKIAKALPDDLNEATLALYLTATTMEAEAYAQLIDRYILKFPQSTDGYVYRARTKIAKNDLAGADEDFKLAIRMGTNKDDAHYQYAQTMLRHLLYNNSQANDTWTLDAALKESEEAYTINPQPVYRQQQAQILYAQKKFDTAYNIYMELTKNDIMKAEAYYAAAECKVQLNDSQTALALMDSAVNTFTKPYIKTAAPYLLTRAQMLFDAKKYRPAVNDFNEYETLMAAQLNAHFYFLREQAEFGGHLYQQALDDIKKAVEMAPDELIYRAEKANLELRVGMTDEAIETAKGCISKDSEASDGYLFLGLALCVKGQKTEGLQNLQKAKELGNSQAQSFIEKYSK